MSDNNNEWQEVGGGAQTDMWDEQSERTIQGKLVNIKKNIGKHHSNIYELDMGDKKIVGVWGGTVLDSRFENIAIGEDVKIQYNGLTPGKGGAIGAYKSYTVFTRKLASAASEVVKEESKSDLPF